ncbi:MAG: S-layer homology domain-containing protein [Synergistes sp.]|nr:S-layer homology domain-containing protein [Synergistes sp.]
MKKFMTAIAMMAVLAFAAPSFAATNPFMDVPQGHWAYDAVGFLASRGVVSGYPDGAYKGAQPATRYEMASIVARALATVDAEKASKQDLEVLKKLVMEFKDELDALGVKVDKIDKRVAVLEKNIGGWSLSGQMYFDAKFWSSDDGSRQSGGKYDAHGNLLGYENDMRQFNFGRARLFLGKQIDENTSLLVRINAADGNFTWDRWYVDTKLPWDINFRFGRFNFDWEGDAGLYDPYLVNNNATFGFFNVDGFQFAKTWGIWNVTAIVGRNLGLQLRLDDKTEYTENNTHMTYALRIAANGEKFMGGAMGYWWAGDNKRDVDTDGYAAPFAHEFSVQTYGLYAGYKFTPAVQLKGIFYWQKLDGPDGWPAADAGTDSPKSWKAILDVKQEALKFTGLWVEYGEEDANFFGNNYVIGSGSYEYGMGDFAANRYRVVGTDSKVKYLNVTADQQWNDKWSTYLHYTGMKFDLDNMEDSYTWGVGVRYQYTPAIQFKLEYAQTDFGDEGHKNKYFGKDKLIRFRTTVNF